MAVTDCQECQFSNDSPVPSCTYDDTILTDLFMCIMIHKISPISCSLWWSLSVTWWRTGRCCSTIFVSPSSVPLSSSWVSPPSSLPGSQSYHGDINWYTSEDIFRFRSASVKPPDIENHQSDLILIEEKYELDTGQLKQKEEAIL